MTIQITDDFDLNRIADSGQCLRSSILTGIRMRDTRRITAFTSSTCSPITGTGDRMAD